MFVLATAALSVTTTIDSSAARRGPRPPTAPSLDLTIVIASDGFGVKTSAGNVAAGCDSLGVGLAVAKKDGDYDYASLNRCVAKIKSKSSDADARDVTLTASPAIPYRDVVAAMDALRRREDGSALFDDVRLGIVR